MSPKRPVYLNLIQIRLPLPGIVSIMHRISGVLMVLAIPLALYVLDLSLSGAEGYAQAAAILDAVLVKLILMVLTWSIMHHLFAGIRYLLIDIDIGVERDSTRKLAWGVLGASIVMTLILWGGLW
ncbi:MAG: succinate dehydrogenase, cytochrome b556 subunit [Gammaproteobacteria bacterium]